MGLLVSLVRIIGWIVGDAAKYFDLMGFIFLAILGDSFVGQISDSPSILCEVLKIVFVVGALQVTLENIDFLIEFCDELLPFPLPKTILIVSHG